MATKKTKNQDKIKPQAKVPVYNFLDAKEIKKIDLDGEIFNGKVNLPLLHQVVIMYQANKRSGAASTKTRGEVSGGGKKPWKQKGTGRARAGSIRSPLWKGGGTTFGPHPRKYSYTLPKKIKRLAVKSALNGKLKDSELFFIDQVKLEKPKTKIFANALEKFLKHTDKKVNLSTPHARSAMFVLDSVDSNLKLASRNVPRVLITGAGNFTALDILLHKYLIISEPALEKINKRLA